MSEPSTFDLTAAQQMLTQFQGQLSLVTQHTSQASMINLDINQAQHLLKMFAQLEQPAEQRKTLLEVLGKNRREVTNSKLLQFFLDTQEAHGLRDLVLQALCRCLRLPDQPVRKTHAVKTEESCKDVLQAGRIDLMVQMQGERIIIENKLFHHAKNNPFESYVEYCEQQWPEEVKHYVLLGLEPPTTLHPSFVFVSHFDLAKQIRAELTEHLGRADHYYLTLLIDYLNTIDNLNPQSRSSKMELALVKFYQDNKDLIQAIVDGFDEVKEHYQQYLEEVFEKLKSYDPELEEQQAFANDVIGSHTGAYLYVYEYVYQVEQIKVYIFATLTEYGVGIQVIDQTKTGRGKNDNYRPALAFAQRHGLTVIDDAENEEVYLLEKQGQVSTEAFVQEILPIVQQINALFSSRV